MPALLLGAGTIQVLVQAGVAPRGLHLELSVPTLAIAVPVTLVTNLLVAWLGAASAGRRASRIPPLAALREADIGARVMTRARWVYGLLFLAIGVGATATLPILGGEVQVPVAIFLAEPFVIAIVLLSPLFLGRLCALAVRGTSATGLLARASLVGGLRRTTSTAAPVVLAVGLCGALRGTTLMMASATTTTERDFYSSDFVITGNAGAALSAARQTPGVTGATPVGMMQATARNSGDTFNQPVSALAVDPATARYALNLTGVTGSPGRLHGKTVMAGRTLASDLGWHLDSEVRLQQPGGAWYSAKVVALYQDNALVESMLLPRDDVIAPATVQVSAPAAAHRAMAQLARQLPGATIKPTATWLRPISASQTSGLQFGSWLLSGFALIYALLSISNTTAMAFRTRRDEFTALHRVGATKKQLHTMVRKESVVIGLTGSLLGSIIAFGTTLATWIALRTYVPDTPPVFPWLDVLAITAASIVMITAVAAVAARQKDITIRTAPG